MMPWPLDIAPLVNAVGAAARGAGDATAANRDDDQLRDGLIQRFEYTYEFCHRMLRRYLRLIAASPEIRPDAVPGPDPHRATSKGCCCGDWPAWRRYRDMRARTSHTYERKPRNAVAAAIPEFLAQAEHLRDQLRSRLA